MRLIPDSSGASDMVEVGWTDAARQSSIQTRMARAYGKSRPASFRAKKPAAPKSSGSGGSKAGGTPKKTGETSNAAGERVLSYNDGGSVTVHKDGKATFTRADGSKVTGTYKEPVKREPRPQGFTSDDDPAVLKKKDREAASAAKKAAQAKANAARGYYPGRARHTKVKVSRTVKGPRAGSGPLTTKG